MLTLNLINQRVKKKISDPLIKLAIKISPERFVNLAYRSILKRDADDADVMAYSHMLRKTYNLDGLLSDIAQSEEHWNQSVTAHAPEIVQQVFQALLNREPETEALHNYSAMLTKSNALKDVITDIAQSQEHWNQSLTAHASEMVQQVFQALLNREPETETLHNYSARLTESNALKDVITDIAQSEEHKARYLSFKNYAASAVESVYQGLLSRPVDSSGVASYEKEINTVEDLIKVIVAVKNSDEYISSFGKQNSNLDNSNMSIWGKRSDHINSLYQRYKGRPVLAKELALHISNEEPIWEIHRNFLNSFTPKNKKPRILIFGAYGNGNLGDTYQALAVSAHIKSNWLLKDADIFACSLLINSDYPFPEGQKLASKAILDIDLVNSFDYLVIGGGGLLAHPHDPLSDENWVKRLNVPIILLGVGASIDLLPLHEALLEHAVYVSARDVESIAAIGSLRKDVIPAPDPILSISSMDTLVELDRTSTSSAKKSDVLWILKHPSNDHDKKILASILTNIQNDCDKIHTIVAIEPNLDKVLDDYFKDTQIFYIETLSELLNHIKNTSVIFSMRYHGAIFSLLLKCQTFGSSQSKIKELFSVIGAHNAYIDHADDICRVFDISEIIPNFNHLANFQSQFQKSLSAFSPPYQTAELEKKYDATEFSRRKKVIKQGQTDFARWSDANQLEVTWEFRCEIAAKFITSDSRILDVGCGAMTLERFLPFNCIYKPCDLIARDTRTIVCDLNKEQLPKIELQNSDIVTLLGVIEYLYQPKELFAQIAEAKKSIIVSYCVTDLQPDTEIRRSLGWVNDFSKETFLSMLETAGFSIIETKAIDSFQFLFILKPIL